VGSVGGAAVLATVLAAHAHAGGGVVARLWTWIEAPGLVTEIGLRLDPLAAVLSLVVGWVGLAIHVYSTAFMAGDRGYARFFASMNLFVASMLVLVTADDLLLLYLGWEGVGLCSFLLIGFWYTDPDTVAAARKAFVVTRIGDAAMALGLFLIAAELNTLHLPTIVERAPVEWTAQGAVPIAVAALLLAGAVGKSAQLPLQVWLPDAMAGPTPVSALIHAATMVTAGVFLLARLHVLLELAPVVQTVVAVIGVATLLLAACSAMVQRDLKRVLAWSTISQLGYMFLALGVGAWTGAVFHLVTHAFFKALLFLAAGVVILRLHHEHDVTRMGGLWRRLPVTFWTFVVGGAALAGVPLVTAGFYSKEAILTAAFEQPGAGPWLWTAGLLGALLTAAYVTRLIVLVFFGDRQTEIEGRTPVSMRVPLVVLAVGAVVTGFLQTPHVLGGVGLFGRYLAPSLGTAHQSHLSLPGEIGLVVAASVASLAGIALGVARFRERRVTGSWGLPTGLEAFWSDGWRFDDLYHVTFVRPWRGSVRALRAEWIDLAFTGTGAGVSGLHRVLRRSQTGRVRWYAAGLVVGALVLVLLGGAP
jgi:NADH-quinone oxidoreductase subunit L